MPRRPTVLLALLGDPGPATRAALGGFERWFREGLEPAADVRLVHRQGVRDAAATADGIVVTGSYASLTERAPWMITLGDALLEASERIPVLGVCFGHQLLAAALGGVVERNPRGPEVGTCEVALTGAGRADPLLEGLPEQLAVQQFHEDHVAAVPPSAVLLASGDHTPVQAFGRGPRLRAVQFHPEFDAARVRAMANEERSWVERGRPGRHAEVVAALREAPEAAGLLRRWVERFV
ncbi:gamma-glutamyl-gamma-aminobutyrate hydrolase family protein [Anaeromyxobacter sp. Fw109-5]|uniref:glutamine amidotransferase-related protein n=1 Tax=Anaeromyxobacter sp. (strain Fw109-5) TaxID=404589 RepID=UPI0000ED710F|nr:gamma-glutamyl-gamma-aminobutyrate hydrolase family protein [Anaeromyxobacter sp. Fw109-5]ABS27852.1 glutamine amidotransferase class-I [Anaeromyxobacter sp. Fw109-5]